MMMEPAAQGSPGNQQYLTGSGRDQRGAAGESGRGCGSEPLGVNREMSWDR